MRLDYVSGFFAAGIISIHASIKDATATKRSLFNSYYTFQSTHP